MQNLKKLLKESLFISSSQYVAVVFSFLTILAITKILGPEKYGVWNFFLIILSFTILSHFGILNSLIKEVPASLGAGNEQLKDKWKNAGFSAILIFSSSISFAVLIFSLSQLNASEKFWGYVFISFISIAQILRSFYEVLFRSHDKFKIVAHGFLIFSISNFVITIPLSYFFAIYGVYAGTLISNLLLLGYYKYRNDDKLKFNIDIPSIKSLVNTGFPIFLYNLSYELMYNTGRIMTIVLLDTERLGQYSLAVNLYNMVYMLPQSFYIVLWPKFFNLYGQTNDKNSIKGYIFNTSTMFAYFIPPIIIPVLFLFEPMVLYFLPKYMSSLIPANIFIWALFFFMTSAISGGLAILNNEIKKFFYVQILIVLITSVLCTVLIQFGFGLNAIALLSTSSYVVFSIILLGYSLNFFKIGLINSIKFYLKIYFPCIFSIMLFIVLGFIIHESADSNARKAFFIASLRIVSYLIIYGLLIYWLNRRFNLFKNI